MTLKVSSQQHVVLPLWRKQTKYFLKAISHKLVFFCIISPQTKHTGSKVYFLVSGPDSVQSPLPQNVCYIIVGLLDLTFKIVIKFRNLLNMMIWHFAMHFRWHWINKPQAPPWHRYSPSVGTALAEVSACRVNFAQAWPIPKGCVCSSPPHQWASMPWHNCRPAPLTVKPHQ